MAQNETWLNHDMMNAVKVQYLDGNVFSQDNAGNLIGVLLTKGGVDYSGGGSISANVIRADGATVAVTGALSGNAATVVLPQAAYAVPGVISIIIKLTAGGATTTIAAVVANVYQSSTDVAVDPGTIIPSIETLIAEIEAAVSSIPADYSSLWTSLASAFDSNKNYTIGQHVTYNGNVWRFTANHSGTWSSSDAVVVTVCGEIEETVSTFSELDGISLISLTPGAYINTGSSTTVVITPLGSSTFDNGGYSVVNCVEGDKFVISGTGTNAGRLWCFIDSSNNVLSRSEAGFGGENIIITAPQNATKLIINSTVAKLNTKGIYPAEQFKGINRDLIGIMDAKPIEFIRKSVSGVTMSSAIVCNLIAGDYIISVDELISSDTDSDFSAVAFYNGETEVLRIFLPRGYDITQEFTLSQSTNNIYLYASNLYSISVGDSFSFDNFSISRKYNLLESDINVNRIDIENPVCIDTSSYSSLSNEISKSGDVITFAKTTSGNTWFTYKLDSSKLQTNFLRMEAEIALQSGSKFRAWMFATNTAGSAINIPIVDISESEDFSAEIDLNYYTVYYSVDTNKPIYFGIANTTSPCYGTITGFTVRNIVTSLDASKSLLENLNEMETGIVSNSNEIDALKNNQYLVSPNGTKYMLAVNNSGEITAIPTIPGKTLFIGNSLLVGNGTFGMCATESTKDYYYHVTQRILSLNPSALFDKQAGYEFEASTTVASAEYWMANTLSAKLNNTLNLVIIQLGDNVNTSAKLSTFETSCGELIQYVKEHAPNARVAWVGEWYATSAKQEIISNACIEKGALFIDISKLYVPENRSSLGTVINYGTSDSREYTIDSYTDDSSNHILTVNFTVNGTQYTSCVPYTSYSASGSVITITGNYGFVDQTGVASHPSNTGFEKIANVINNSLGF